MFDSQVSVLDSNIGGVFHAINNIFDLDKQS